jgi:RNA polymerase sigma factor (sigma-70 family)
MNTNSSRVACLVCKARDQNAALSQQHAAFTKLVEQFEQMAFATALGASSDADRARDACQEAFLSAWRRLPRLREPAAFGGWLKRLVLTQCARDRRRAASVVQRMPIDDIAGAADANADPAALLSRRESESLIKSAVDKLPTAERRAVMLFYFLGEPLRTIARALGITVEHAGKLVYSARLRLRRTLPRSITEQFLVVTPQRSLTRYVQAGVFNEFLGEYRFPNRPNHAVIIRSEGNELASYARGQRNILASRRADSLMAIEFDGEARFQRCSRGHVTGFIYYEFGRRLGVARKVKPA